MSILQIFDTGSGYKLIDPEATETGGTTGGTSGNIILDLITVRNFDITATGSITWTFANAPTGRKLTTTFKLILVNGGLGTQTWPASVTWLSGSSPTLKSSGTNILQFTTNDNGTTWLGVDITPATSIAVTGTSLTSTGFTLDPSVATNISFWAFRTNALTADPRFQYSNNGGTTWTTFGSTFNNFSTNIGLDLPPALRAQISLIYYNSMWHFTSQWWTTPVSGTFATGAGAKTHAASGRSATFTPTATTIYRFDFNQAGWTVMNPSITTA